MAGSVPSDPSFNTEKDLYDPAQPGRNNPEQIMTRNQGSGGASPVAMVRSDTGAKSGRADTNHNTTAADNNRNRRARNHLLPAFQFLGLKSKPPKNDADGHGTDNHNGAPQPPVHKNYSGNLGMASTRVDPESAAFTNNVAAPSTATTDVGFLDMIHELVREHTEVKASMLEYRQKNDEYMLALERAETDKSALRAALATAEQQLRAAEADLSVARVENGMAARKIQEGEGVVRAMVEALKEAKAAAAVAEAEARELHGKLELEKEEARQKVALAAEREEAAAEREAAAVARAIEAQRKVDHMKRKCDRYVKVLFGRVEELRASNGVAAGLRRQYERLGAAFQDLTEKLERASVLEEERHSVQEKLHHDICAALGIGASVSADSVGIPAPPGRRLQIIVEAVHSVDVAFDSCASELLALMLQQQNNPYHFVDVDMITRKLDPDQAPSSLYLYKLGLQELLCSTFFSDFERWSYGVGDLSPSAATDALLQRLTSFDDFFTSGGSERKGRRFRSPRERKRIALETYQRFSPLGARQIYELQLMQHQADDVSIDGVGEEMYDETADLSSGDGMDPVLQTMKSVSEEFYKFAQGKWCPNVFQHLLDSGATLTAAVTVMGGGGSAGKERAATRLPEELMSEENPLGESFGEAARAVWLLHKVAEWLKAEMVRVSREAAFDPDYMEAVHKMVSEAAGGEVWGDNDSAAGSDPRHEDVLVVNFMCLPGFIVGDDVVIKARVSVRPGQSSQGWVNKNYHSKLFLGN